MVRPMYHSWPDVPAAYAHRNSFLFGSELVVAPVTTPRDPVTLLGSARCWLPSGTWTDIVTEVVYDGDGTVELHRDSSSIPVLLHAGGILPLATGDGVEDLDAAANPVRLEVLIAPGADGRFMLYEDDGTGQTVDDAPTVTTELTWDQTAGSLTIGPAKGPAGVVPTRRTWTARLLGEAPAEGAVTVADASTREAAVARFAPDPSAATRDVPERIFALLNRAQCAFTTKAAIWQAVTSGRPVESVIASLVAMELSPALLSAVVELLTARRSPDG
jgi:hypothetical protein